ncbi:MAG: CHAT domain-containing protein, partial [Planctomycetes bacterium]|nr:CHAT domain-containing protein [Planctomycetota bacterium]
QIEAGDVAGAYETIERGRAAVLRSQLASTIADPLASAVPAEAKRLRELESTARAEYSIAKSKLQNALRHNSKSSEPSKDAIQRMSEEVRLKQRNLVSVEAEIRTASPQYREALARIETVWPLTELQEYLQQKNAVFLEYAIWRSAGYVLVVSGKSPPSIEALFISPESAAVLGTTPGPLTADRCRLALVNRSGTGVYQQIATAVEPLSTKSLLALTALSDSLLPSYLQEDLNGNKVQQLIVAPDAPHALLPFEVLLPGEFNTDRYLLDLTSSVTYTPSATVLRTLLDKKTPTKATGPGTGALIVGDPEYTKYTSSTRSLAPQSLYQGLGGKLSKLVHAGLECTWITDTFRKENIATTTLLNANATEQAVFKSAPQKQLIHFACHGFADDRFGNAFGALAISPGSASGNLADDGVLTLNEISRLDLKSCELAILSACETNIGPEQRSEGVWSLSRGFLIAGSHRVAATNWMVDDEATASLVSYFCSGIAQDWNLPAGPNYAKRLHDAKRWVRQQEKWKSPYFWGSFVLVGPN